MRNNQLTLLASSIVFIEWVEFSLYMYLGTLLSHFFFPQDLGSHALLLTYAIFAISYLSRPLGGLLFGLYADKHGRRSPLIISSLLIGLATIAIGCIPSYQHIGLLAPILLLIFRLVQSLAISGEFNNSAIYLMEHNPKRTTLAGSWIGTASSAGMFVGGLIAVLVSASHHPHSWRLAYIVIGCLSLLLMLLRKRLLESPSYQQMLLTQPKTSHQAVLSQLIKHHQLGLI
ncbi:MFS transporter, partial [Piscirickettsia litoralis]|uniref:MFS transporter n=1 Tax=Piscirickettsia litoralis TaxID=1891921 RepID=UPI00098261D1